MFSHLDLCNAMIALFNQAEAHDRLADDFWQRQSSREPHERNADMAGLASWHRTRAGELRKSAAVFQAACKPLEK